MMSSASKYRAHPVWEVIDTKFDHVEQARTSKRETEELRLKLLEALKFAQRLKVAPAAPFLYEELLDQLLDEVNGITITDSFLSQYFSNNSYGRQTTNWLSFKEVLRQFSLAPRGLSNSYIRVIDDAVEIDVEKVADLSNQVGDLDKQVKDLESKAVTALSSIDKAQETVEEIANDTATEIGESLSEEQEAWKAKNEQELSEQMELVVNQLSSLATAAKLGERLAHHAASRITSSSWLKRATRDRKSGQRLLYGAIGAFVAAACIGYFAFAAAIAGHVQLSVGDGLVRFSMVAVAGTLGGYLMRVSSNRFSEANSAEEVATVVNTLEAYYADVDSEERQAAVKKTGDAVFFQNVLSRFSQRDATKYGENNQNENRDLSKLLLEVIAHLNSSGGGK